MKEVAASLNALISFAAITGIFVLVTSLAALRKSSHTSLGRALLIFCGLIGVGLLGLAIYMGNLAIGLHGK